MPAAASPPPTTTPSAPAAAARLLTPALLGWLAGITAQLQQAKLWPGASYVLLLGSALALLMAGLRAQANTSPPGQPRFSLTASVLALLAATLVGYASTGLRALSMQAEAPSPALEQ
ncbi:hypothetical protein ACQV5M_19765, partial [Leptospira sp. SA-E8]|uniref:hypothetical protein n=1 Tax=Leptospira sp. SA-E8 TaxID=3422259 RepID=UPI003EBAA9D9